MEYDVMTTPTKCLYMLLFIHALTHALTDSSLTHALTHPFEKKNTFSFKKTIMSCYGKKYVPSTFALCL